MRPLVGVLVGIALVVLAGGAHAADASPPPPPAQAAAPAQPPPVWNGTAWVQPPPPPPGGFAPYGPAYPPAYPPPYAYAPVQPAGEFYYESQKKNELLALVIEFFVPGVGSIYAGHVAGAMITWALTVGGIVLAFWWLGENINRQDQFGNNADTGPVDTWAIYVALGAILGGRIYGLVDSFTSAREFNHQLRQRLGLPDYASIGVVPIRTDRAISWGPSLSFRF
jgi:TM2 domain-containing membrane protein YozV